MKCCVVFRKGCILYDGVEGLEDMAKEATKTLNGTEGKVQLSSMDIERKGRKNNDKRSL